MTGTKICIEVDSSNGENPEPVVKTFTQTIGDGFTTVFNVDHDLGTADVIYSVRNLSTGMVDAYDVSAVATPDALTLTFAVAPAVSGARVVIVAV